MWSKGHRLELSKIRQVRRSVMIVLQFVSLELQQTLTNVIRKHGNPFPSELRRCSLLRPRMVSSLCCPAVRGPANGQDWYQTLQLFLRIGIQGESRQPETEWVSSSFLANYLTFMCSVFLLQESLNEILKLIPFSRAPTSEFYMHKKSNWASNFLRGVRTLVACEHLQSFDLGTLGQLGAWTCCKHSTTTNNTRIQ